MGSLSSTAAKYLSKSPELRLHQAVIAGNLEEVQRCVKVDKVDVHIRDNNGLTALRHALDRSNYEMIKVLIQAGAEVNTPSHCGKTAFHLAQNKHDFPFFLDLLSRGADINIRDECRQTTLNKSIMYQKKTSEVDDRIFMLLLEHGADVNAVDCHGFTALHIAASDNRDRSHSNIIKMLLEKGADVNARNNWGLTPIHKLVEEGNVKLVQLFLDSGAEVNVKNCQGRIPLFNAIWYGTCEVVELLLKHGSDVNSADNCGFTPLHQAARWNKGKIAEILLRCGADVNAQDQSGKTPLHYSVDLNVAWVLLNHQADVNIPDNTGEIPLTQAIQEKNYKIVELLMHRCSVSTIQIILSNNPDEKKWKPVLENLAKLKTRGFYVSSSLFESVSNQKKYKEYFERCTEELKIAESTRLCNSWVSYFNLLIDDEIKLANYARNTGLVKDFQNSNCLEKFPIFGSSMYQNISEGIKRRRVVDESVVILGECLPIKNAPVLIVKKILDYVSVNDIYALCKKTK